MSQFVHLHLHSQYSLLDGANRLDRVIDAAVEQGMPAIALTDHGNMFGAVEFYNRARAAGIKPIVGMEAYTTQGSMTNRDRRIDVYMQKATQWRAEMEALREIVLTTPVQETFKWRQPCYVWQGTNVCMPGAYGGRVRLSFFRGVLLDDPEGLLVPPKAPAALAAALLRIAGDPQLAQRLSATGRARIERDYAARLGAEVIVDQMRKALTREGAGARPGPDPGPPGGH